MDASPAIQQPSACGELPCELFDTPESAFARVLRDKPRVLALGETHPLANAPQVQTTAVRMSALFLPMLRGVASDFVLELWVGNPGCNAKQKQEIRAVQTAQREVTQNQASTNQSDFLRLYKNAHAQGMGAHVLVPDCEAYGKIVASGGADIDMMLTLVARLSGEKVETLLGGGDAGPAPGMIVAYGGAMHNDRVPRPGHEAWSYGPTVAKRVPNGYVELDLVIPEYVKDTDAWRGQPWYSHFTRGLQGSKTLLYTLRPGAYVLVFPETQRSDASVQ